MLIADCTVYPPGTIPLASRTNASLGSIRQGSLYPQRITRELQCILDTVGSLYGG
jgi:hypothetical protein